MLDHIVIISLAVIGYCCTFWEGMIFEKLGDWLEVKLPEWLQKPLYSCFICSCFWWGSLVYWVMWHENLVKWFITVVAAMGFNAVIARLIEKNEKE